MAFFSVDDMSSDHRYSASRTQGELPLLHWNQGTHITNNTRRIQ